MDTISASSVAIPWPLVAQLTFLLLLIVYVIFTVVFYYHWQSYSTDKAATIQTYIAYFLVSVPLLAIMGLAVLVM